MKYLEPLSEFKKSKVLKKKVMENIIVLFDDRSVITVLKDNVFFAAFPVEIPTKTEKKIMDTNLIDFDNNFIILIVADNVIVYSILHQKKVKVFKLQLNNNLHVSVVKIIVFDIIIGNEKGKTVVYDLKSGEIKHSFRPFSDFVTDITEDRTFLFIHCYNGSVSVNDLISYQNIKTFKRNREVVLIKRFFNVYLCVLKTGAVEILDLNFIFIKNLHLPTIESQCVFLEFYKNSLLFKYKDNYKVFSFDRDFNPIQHNTFENEIENLYVYNDKFVVYDGISFFTFNDKDLEKQIIAILDKPIVIRHDLEKIRYLQQNNLFLDKDKITELLEKRYRKDMLEAIKLMYSNQKEEAILKLDKWKLFEDKQKTVNDFQKNMGVYATLRQFYKDGKITMIYNLARQHDTLKYTPEFLRTEIEFDKIIQYIISHEEIKKNPEEVYKLTDKYANVVEKSKMISNIIKDFENTTKFINYCYQKNYKLVYTYVEKLKNLAELDLFKTIDKYVDLVYLKTKNEIDISILEEYIKIIEYKPEYKVYVQNLKNELNAYRIFKDSYQNNSNYLVILEKNKENNLILKSKEYQKIVRKLKNDYMLVFKNIEIKTNHDIIKSMISYKKTLFHSYILDLIKEKYKFQIEGFIKNNENSEGFSYKFNSIICNYAGLCGNDENVDIWFDMIGKNNKYKNDYQKIELDLELFPETIIK